MRKYEVTINNKLYAVLVKKYSTTDAELEINGKPYLVKLDAPITSVAPPVSASLVGVPSPAPVQAPVAQPTPVAATPPPTTGSSGGTVVTAPIPGSILEITVKVGDAVTDGQTVIKMEAMKMENDINATAGGTVKAISVNVGEAVNQGQELIIIE